MAMRDLINGNAALSAEMAMAMCFAAGIQEDPPDQTDPGVLAVVSCRQAHAPVFRDRLLPITWTRDADSTAALFRFETGYTLPSEPVCLEIRLYARAGLHSSTCSSCASPRG